MNDWSDCHVEDVASLALAVLVKRLLNSMRLLLVDTCKALQRRLAVDSQLLRLEVGRQHVYHGASVCLTCREDDNRGGAIQNVGGKDATLTKRLEVEHLAATSKNMAYRFDLGT